MLFVSGIQFKWLGWPDIEEAHYKENNNKKMFILLSKYILLKWELVMGYYTMHL